MTVNLSTNKLNGIPPHRDSVTRTQQVTVF